MNHLLSSRSSLGTFKTTTTTTANITKHSDSVRASLYVIRTRPARAESVSSLARCNKLETPSDSPGGSEPKRTPVAEEGISDFQLSSLMRGKLNRSNQFKWQLALLIALILTTRQVLAGFWTFYLPNALKPSGYKEVSDLINLLEADVNATKDAYEDHKYFWSLLKNMDSAAGGGIYPEDSVCSEVFPLFRDLASEYSEADYEHFIRPLELHQEHLIGVREQWYPDGPKSKTILPREWEQKLHEHELELRLEWYEKLAENEELKMKRKRMVEIWASVKRGLDTSLACVYLRYAYRQVSKDINQMALEMNVAAIKQALRMVRAAYTRIAKWQKEDEEAILDISESMDEQRKFNVQFDH